MNRFFTFTTTGAFGSKHPVIVVNAIYFIVDIDCEWHPVQTLITDATSEATRMVRLAHGLQYLKFYIN